MPSEVTRYLNRNSPFSAAFGKILFTQDDDLPEETRSDHRISSS